MERVVSAKIRAEELAFEASLRPRRLDEFIGQERLKENLRIAITAAQQRGEALDHLLLYGPPGLGKTTLAHIMANEMGVSIKTTSGPAIEHAGDLAAILTNLRPLDILFIDEIHRLGKVIEEKLYPVMEEFAFDLIVGKGPGARSLRLSLPSFTLIGATTRFALLSPPLRDRFGAVYRLDFYDLPSIEAIIRRSAKVLKVEVEEGGVKEIACRSRGTPRVANRLLKRLRDFAQVKAQGIITEEVAKEALHRIEIDHKGLDEMDIKLLQTIIHKFDGGPVGLETLAAAIGEEADTIMDIYEPYLLQLGFIERTPRGRLATRLAYQHLGLPYKRETQPALW